MKLRATGIALALVLTVGAVAFAKGGKFQPGDSSRKPASLTKVQGQGQLMLQNLTNPYPSFLAPLPTSRSKAPLRIGAVCRDSLGVSHSSLDPGFAQCFNSSQSSGTSINDYFGSAQRQAGFGIGLK